MDKGTYDELLRSASSTFTRLLANIHQQEEQEQVQSEYHTDNRSRCMTVSENDSEEETPLTNSQNFEVKQEGVVKWHVHIAYLRAGVGLFGIFLLIFILGFREGTVVLSRWWLAEWSDDENHRYRPLINCSNIVDTNMNRIHSMNDTEWNMHRNNRFYFYCGESTAFVLFSIEFFLQELHWFCLS